LNDQKYEQATGDVRIVAKIMLVDIFDDPHRQ